MKKYSIRVIGIPLMGLLLSGGYFMTQCKHDATDLEQFDTVCFDKDVLTIFQKNCNQPECHGAGGKEFPLTNYNEIVSKVSAGNPSSSDIYRVITAKFLSQQMPPNYALSQTQRTYIRLWILQGAKETHCKSDTSSNNIGTVSACFSRDILPALNASCTMSGCHDVASHQGDYVFTDYANTLKAVSKENVSGSKLYQVITASGEDLMPPSGPLAKSVIDSIASWIKAGATNSTCAESCNLTNVTFSKTILPIVLNSCSSCHSSSYAKGGVVLSNYNDVQAIAKSGKLVGTVTATGYSLMPTSGKLSDCKIDQIKTWVKAGSPNN